MATKKAPDTESAGDLKTREGKVRGARASKSSRLLRQDQRFQAKLEKGLAVLRQAVPRIKAGALVEPETKGNIPLEPPAHEGSRVEVFDMSTPERRWETLKAALASVLRDWGVPETDFEATAAELERVARARANAARRPKWDERGRYAELKNLSAPQFLKRVYGDVIAPDGSVEKQAIRDIDPKLMASVEVYMSNRKKREQDAGDAAGLRLIAGPTSPHRQANLS